MKIAIFSVWLILTSEVIKDKMCVYEVKYGFLILSYYFPDYFLFERE